MKTIRMKTVGMSACGMLVEPSFGVLNHIAGAALDATPTLLGLGLSWKVIVEIEAAIKSWSELVAIENYGADKSGGLIALFLE